MEQELPKQRPSQKRPRTAQQTWQSSSLNIFWSHSQKEVGLVNTRRAETERETTAESISYLVQLAGCIQEDSELGGKKNNQETNH